MKDISSTDCAKIKEVKRPKIKLKLRIKLTISFFITAKTLFIYRITNLSLTKSLPKENPCLNSIKVISLFEN
jgi:hypothetical protein